MMPTTKSEMVITTTMTQIVQYSHRFTRPKVSHTASRTRSMPSTKMSAPTTGTGRYPIAPGPRSRMPIVPRASITPLSREPPPTL